MASKSMAHARQIDAYPECVARDFTCRIKFSSGSGKYAACSPSAGLAGSQRAFKKPRCVGQIEPHVVQPLRQLQHSPQ